MIIEIVIRFPIIVGLWSIPVNLLGIKFNPYTFVEKNAHLIGLDGRFALLAAFVWAAIAFVWLLMDLKRLVTKESA